MITFVLAALSLLSASPAKAEVQSAGVRESYVTPFSFDFGSDRMARVKRNLFDMGFTSVTAHVRLGMQSPTSDYVYAPSIRSTMNQIATLVARVNHSHGEFTIKPVIGLNPGIGVITRLTDINPKDTDLWFTTYFQGVKPYIEIAAEHEVTELVLGVGLHHLWKAEYADRWKALIYEARRKIVQQGGLKTRLSFELSSEEDFKAFETWKKTNLRSFREVMESIDRIRISVGPQEGTPGAGDWDSVATTTKITDLLARAQNLFVRQTFMLANVTVPACKDRSSVEDEIICAPPTSKDDLNFDANYQAFGLQSWLKALVNLNPEVRKQIREIELLQSTTEFDPEVGKSDARFMIFNKKAIELLAPPKKAEAPAVDADEEKPSSKPAIKKPTPAKAEKKDPKKKVSSRGPASDQATEKKACIFFDETGKKKDLLGPIHARMLETLVGAFKNWGAEIFSARKYKQGTLDQCDAAFYISSNFELKLSQAFLLDTTRFIQTKQFVWMNYKFETFSTYYTTKAAKFNFPKLAFDSTKVIQPQSTPGPNNQDPGFYRYFDYKGETFEKLARWDTGGNWFSSSPELNEIAVKEPTKLTVHATARHSKADSTTPYIVSQKINQGKIWYIADLPLAFVHHEDRYFILCDLMWDILDTPPPTGPKPALVRIEDVNPNQNQVALRWAIDYLADNNIPFSLAVIPYYSSVFSGDQGEGKPTWKPVTKYPQFIGTLRYAKARGANFVWHGVAHQAGDLISGFDGSTGADYEFWSYPENKPLPNDSSDYVLDMLEKGESVFKKLDIAPVAWEVPHYAASALDFMLFGKLFEWTYQRPIYFKQEITSDVKLAPEQRMFECKDNQCRNDRRVLARQIKVNADYGAFGGQMVPFPVYKDTFGQAVIPETLGLIDYPFYNENNPNPVSHPADIVRRAKKLRVIRGAYASFFWHPDLLMQNLQYYHRHPENYETEGGKHTLMNAIEGIQALGYEFKSIGDCKLFPRAACNEK